MEDELLSLDADYAGELYVALKGIRQECRKELQKEIRKGQKVLAKMDQMLGRLEIGVATAEDLVRIQNLLK